MKQTYLLRAGRKLTVSGTATGYIARLAAPGAGDQKAAWDYDGTTQKFGPYPEHESFLVETFTGAVTVAISSPDMATDTELAAAVAAAISGTLAPGGLVVPEKTPVNAAAASVDILAAELAVMNNDDTLTFAGVDFVKKGSTNAEEGEFVNAAGLAACVNELLGDDWTAAEDTDVTITSDTKGATGFNGLGAVASIIEDTTANGAEAVAATATIAAATLAAMAVGDTVAFDGNTFTKVAEEPEAGEFTDTAELIALIDALDDWDAVENTGAIDITAAAVGAEWNDKDIVITLTRTTADGVDGTVADAGTAYADATYLYIAKDDNTTADTNWRRIALGSAY
jgi:hypothetical protein